MKVKLFALTGWALYVGLSSGLLANAQRKAAVVSEVTASESVTFELYIPLAHKAALEQLLADQQTTGSAQYHQWLTPAQIQTRFGPSAETVAAVTQEMSRYGLTVTQISPQLLQVSGSGALVTEALGAPLVHGVTAKGRSVVFAARPVSLPSVASSAGAMLTGLSGTVRQHTHAKKAASTANRYSPAGSYWFDDLKQAYTFPSYKSYSGKGSKIGILIPSAINASDMAAYFGHEGLAVPKITVETVLGGEPFDPNSDSSFEAELDVQQSGGMAPDAKITVYDIPDLSDDSIIAGLDKIVSDNKVDVVSISFGGPELAYTAAYNSGEDFTYLLRAEDEIMAKGNAMGITFVASSGDLGALSIPSAACFSENAPTPCGTFQASVEFPASSPHVTGVGGTNLKTVFDANNPNDLNSAYVSEEAYADSISGDYQYGTTATGAYFGSGGGDSVVFAKPFYQLFVPTGRGTRTVPDVALHMGGCPGVPPGFTETCSADDSSDVEAFAGGFYGVIGTSAAAPAFAGLTALNIEKSGGRVGNENAYIYTLSALQSVRLIKNVYHWGIPGFNGLYSSGNEGYNRVLGNGTLYGKDFLLAPEVPSAGIPQTPSNP
ncbi:protease pro-enzyme activation domain-containing protein [Granulicella sp. L46]|uniref:S53 family peptidase n=1 Tax=Granulicella sp. L46 TaxID=1641865 RepID=UPI00131A64B1|nr:S53 family serine peptidase [Granulicella sp. L46]